MSKGGGSGGAGGGRMRGSDASMKANFLRNGLTGHQINQSGLRPESFAHLRAGGVTSPRAPVTVKVTAKGNHIVDGRHRITLAREAGHSTIHARVLGEGPRGGIRWKHTGHIKI